LRATPHPAARSSSARERARRVTPTASPAVSGGRYGSAGTCPVSAARAGRRFNKASAPRTPARLPQRVRGGARRAARRVAAPAHLVPERAPASSGRDNCFTPARRRAAADASADVPQPTGRTLRRCTDQQQRMPAKTHARPRARMAFTPCVNACENSRSAGGAAHRGMKKTEKAHRGMKK
jgi:hypothetical protein